jgi:hypothetical protein
MQRVVWTCALLLTGCGGASDSTPELAIDGDWSLAASAIAGTCPVQGSVFPVAPGLTTIQSTAGVVELSSADGLLTYAVDGREWRRSRTVSLDGCSGEISETWLIHSASGRRLSATYSMNVEVHGDCSAYGVESCRMDYGVWGVQP